MKSIAATVAPACSKLHVSALRRVARGSYMFDNPTRDPIILQDRRRVSQDLRRWCLIDGHGQLMRVTRAGYSVLGQLGELK